MRVPAVCDKCGTIFPSGFEVNNSTNVTFSGCGSGPCPKCGGDGHIPDGVYNFIGNTIELLSGPKRTVSELERLSNVLRKAREQSASLEQVSTTIQNDFPELSSLKDFLPRSRSELYAFIAILLTIIGLILGQIKRSESPKIEINQVIDVIYENQPKTAAPKKFTPSTHDATNAKQKKNKVGRNDPCPCDSGKKFKKCCLDK